VQRSVRARPKAWPCGASAGNHVPQVR
jgi:hypothetical protein